MAGKDREMKNSGKYVYDKKLKKIVKVNSDITGLKKGGSSSDSCPTGCPGGTCGL